MTLHTNDPCQLTTGILCMNNNNQAQCLRGGGKFTTKTTFKGGKSGQAIKKCNNTDYSCTVKVGNVFKPEGHFISFFLVFKKQKIPFEIYYSYLCKQEMYSYLFTSVSHLNKSSTKNISLTMQLECLDQLGAHWDFLLDFLFLTHCVCFSILS